MALCYFSNNKRPPRLVHKFKMGFCSAMFISGLANREVPTPPFHIALGRLCRVATNEKEAAKRGRALNNILWGITNYLMWWWAEAFWRVQKVRGRQVPTFWYTRSILMTSPCVVVVVGKLISSGRWWRSRRANYKETWPKVTRPDGFVQLLFPSLFIVIE